MHILGIVNSLVGASLGDGSNTIDSLDEIANASSFLETEEAIVSMISHESLGRTVM
jgi:hypothetical protein